MLFKDLKQKKFFKVEPKKLYDILMDSKLHSELTGSESLISRKVGGKFSVWNDDITGKNLELVPGKKIVQFWRLSDWPEKYFSKVTFEFKNFKNGTMIEFSHMGIPEASFKDTKQGWKDYYWEPLKNMVKNINVTKI